MKHKYVAAAIFGCLAVLLISGAVFAEGELPPESPPNETEIENELIVAPVIEETPPDEIEPIVEPTEEMILETQVEFDPEATIVIQEVEEPTLDIEETATVEQAETSEILTDLVEENVILVDASGEELALATRDAADALIAPDPYFYVGAVKYSFTTADCNPSIAGNQPCSYPIQAAIDFVHNTGILPSDGKIYVEAGTFSDTVIIDGTLTYLNLLKGLIGEPSVTGSYPTDLTGSVTVHHVTAGFTLSGFNIANNVTFYNNTGTVVLSDLYVHDSTTGIQVYNQLGAIKLNKVRAENNLRRGAYLNNTMHTSAGIEVINSSFNYNTVTYKNYSGLDIRTNGVVTINGVASSNNRGDGLRVYEASAVTIKNSVFSNNIDEDNLGYWGRGVFMEIHRSTPLTIDHVYAVNNENYGMDVSVGGKITVSKSIISDNDLGGAYLDNCGYDSGTGECHSTLFSPVTITDSYFENNSGGDGLEIRSKGAVLMTSIRAYNNNGDGVDINNCNFYNGACQGIGRVMVSSNLSLGIGGVNFFGWNSSGDGLYINSMGAVTIYNFEAINNSSDGIQVYNRNAGATGSVTIKSTLSGWVNRSTHNAGDGIEIDTNGTILITKVESRSNDDTGFELDNDFIGVIKNITVSNCQANLNDHYGIWAESNGGVTIINTEARNNDLSKVGSFSGLYIDNSGGTGNVSIKSTDPKNYYGFNFNSGNGIKIITNGKVTISNAIASYNTDTVNDVNNDGFNIGGAIDPKSIVLTRCVADNNGWNGFQLQSLGTILLTNVSASQNTNNGIIAYSAGNFTLKKIAGTPDNELNDNGNPFNADGLYVSSGGTVTILNTMTYLNNAYGMSINNAPSLTTPVKIQLSIANYNHYGGIYINTASNLIVTDTSASYNDSWGMYADTDGKILVNCTKPMGFCNFSNNATGDGLDLYARKTITIRKIVASDNGNDANDHGMDLHSYFTPSPIILSNVRVEGNWYYGILADTDSNVTINNVLARYNSVGVSVGTGAFPVTNVLITGNNLFDGNASGLEVYANGTVKISNVTAQFQTNGRGVHVISSGEGMLVTLNNVVSRYNYDDGIYINSQGNVNLTTVRCISNGTAGNDRDGLVLEVPDQEDIITIKNSTFIYNFGNGIEANVFSSPIDYAKFKLLTSYYLGNDADHDWNADLFIH